MKKQIHEFAFLVMILLVLTIINANKSEAYISWVYNPEDYSVEKCLEESENTPKACKLLVELIDKAEKEKEVIVQSVMEEKK